MTQVVSGTRKIKAVLGALAAGLVLSSSLSSAGDTAGSLTSYEIASNGLLRLPASQARLELKNIEIHSHAQLLVPTSVQSLTIDELKMAEGARLFVAPRSEPFELNIRTASFADGSTISARGVTGEVGVPGGKGTDLLLSVAQAQVTNLRIDVRGGDGGAGWNGVPGSDGRKAACWGRGSHAGSAGGDGANGLSGGQGGNVELKLADKRWLEVIDLMQAGGQAGEAGKGALGGAEGQAAECWLYRVNSASEGSAGTDGQSGREGPRGSLRVH